MDSTMFSCSPVLVNTKGDKEAKRVILDIAPRKQWENGHGYCGETSIQSIGLYYGCWISQKLIRSINQGEFLLTDDENDSVTLVKLLFEFDTWPFKSEAEPQYKRYVAWLKHHLLQSHPCIITVYIDDGDDDDDYDHIMPAIGIQYSGTDHSYDPTDVLLFYNLFDFKLLERQLSTDDMIQTRKTCRSSAAAGGCLPKKFNYGYAILGIKDKQRVTVPVRLKVNLSEEPNLSLNEAPALMQGTITVFDLEPDRDYVLLRYKSHREVPKAGDVQAFLHSNYYKRHDFRAMANTYTYVDPEAIPSNGATYYRCVPAKGAESTANNERSESDKIQFKSN